MYSIFELSLVDLSQFLLVSEVLKNVNVVRTDMLFECSGELSSVSSH